MTTRAEQSMSMFGVVTLAATAGAIIGLLYAPRKGSETRDQIRLKMRETKLRSQDTIETTKTKAQTGIDKIKRKTDETSQDISDKVTEARSQVEDTVAEATPKTTGRRPSSSV